MSYQADFITWLAERDSITLTQAEGLCSASNALRPLTRNAGLEVWCQQVAGERLASALALPADRLNEAASLFGQAKAMSELPVTLQDFTTRMQGDWDEWKAEVESGRGNPDV